MNVTQWIKESCDHQDAKTPEDYIGMALAHEYAMTLRWSSITMRDIVILARRVNHNEFLCLRTTPVTFADLSVALAPEHIVRQLELLIDQINGLLVTNEEFYQRFEEIHPFEDGNGRVGALLYNVFSGWLDDPVHPPEFKKG